MKKNLIKVLGCACSMICFHSCFFLEHYHSDHLVYDFYLDWFEGNLSGCISMKSSPSINQDFSACIINEAVVSVGYNREYIIAKQRVDLRDRLNWSLFLSDTTGYYKINTIEDTIYLAKDDAVFQMNGVWYHQQNKINNKIDLKEVYYFIIDLREYNKPNSSWDLKESMYKFKTFKGFWNKFNQLGFKRELKFDIK